jgi:archaellum component FlaC
MRKLNLEFNEGDLIIADDFNQIVGEVNSQYDAIGTVTSQISDLGGSVQSVVTQVNTLDTNISTVTSQISDLGGSIESIVTQVNTLDNNMSTVNSDLETVSSEVNDLKTKIKFHVGTLEERDEYDATSGDIWMIPSY